MPGKSHYRSIFGGQLVLAGVKPSCETCKWFRRLTEHSIGTTLRAVASPDNPDEEVDGAVLLEFGRCVRNPPQFFYETLNGEWPIIHESKVCGEYRHTDNNPYAN